LEEPVAGLLGYKSKLCRKVAEGELEYGEINKQQPVNLNRLFFLGEGEKGDNFFVAQEEEIWVREENTRKYKVNEKGGRVVAQADSRWLPTPPSLG
jgi:hypothetical protein